MLKQFAAFVKHQIGRNKQFSGQTKKEYKDTENKLQEYLPQHGLKLMKDMNNGDS